MSRARWLLVLRAGISIGLIGLILWRVDLRATLSAVRDVNLWALAAALCAGVFPIGLRAYKWHLLLGVQGGSRPFSTSLRVTYMSTFINNFFLGTLGGDAFRAYHASDYSDSKGGAASAVVMERATGVLSALLLVFASGIFMTYEFVTTELLLAISFVALVALLALGALALVGARAGQIPILRKVSRLTGLIEEMSGSLMAYKNHGGVLLVSMILSLGFHAMQAVTLVLYAMAAGTSAPFLALLFIAPLTGILAVLPISINGIGVKEGSLVFLLERIGTSGPEALLIALFARIGNMAVSLIGGLLFLLPGSERQDVVAGPEDRYPPLG